MLIEKKPLYALLTAIVMLPSYAQPTLTSPQDAYINKKIQSWMTKNHISGTALELFVNGKPYEYYFGYADKEKKQPIISKTIFEIGSISKVMTGLLAAQELDWAKIDFNDSVTKYIKDLPPSFAKVSIQDLATHTSGLPFAAAYSIQTQDELKTYLNSRFSQLKANKQWQYSNLGVSLLGLALENSTDSEFSDLYRRHILNPLKMVNGVTIPKAYNKYYAQGFDKDGHSIEHEKDGVFSSAYGIKASAVDMQHFLSAAIGLPGTPSRVFWPMRMTQSAYVKIDNQYQGLGWMIHKLDKNSIHGLLNANDSRRIFSTFAIQETYPRAVYNNNALMDKTGSTNGFSSYIGVIPGKQSGIVVLTNKNIDSAIITQLSREILFKVSQV